MEEYFVGLTSNSGGAVSEESVIEEEASESVSEDDQESDKEAEPAHDLGSYLLARDREIRNIKPPSKFEDADYLAYTLSSAEDVNSDEPKSYLEAQQSKDGDLWNGASAEEMESLEKNQMWFYVERPKNHIVIGCKWVYKLKPGVLGIDQPPRYKSRLVAKGFAQIEGFDYNEVFTHVVNHISIRLLLSAVVHFDMELEQMDGKTAFLNGVLKENIFMEQPEGYIQKGK